jgi:Dullard-like phosphatase family protein
LVDFRSHLNEAVFDVFDFLLLAQAGAMHTKLPMKSSIPTLPPSKFTNRRTLCLDMDDTLTLMCVDGSDELLAMNSVIDPDTFVISRENPNERGFVYLRPYLRTFLEAVSRIYEVVVFTAACQDYADQILDFIDPYKRLFHYRLYRDSCVQCIPNPQSPDVKVYVKDLRVLGRDLGNVILVDNSLQCFAYQLDGGILCNPYKGDPQDAELISILEVLGFVNRNPEDHVGHIFKKMYGIYDLLREYKSKGGREGVRRINAVPWKEVHEYATPKKDLMYADEDTNFSQTYPYSVEKRPGRKETSERIVYNHRGTCTGENHPYEIKSESAPRRRLSLVPSATFRASLGGG